jgi:hypothetical protein
MQYADVKFGNVDDEAAPACARGEYTTQHEAHIEIEPKIPWETCNIWNQMKSKSNATKPVKEPDNIQELYRKQQLEKDGKLVQHLKEANDAIDKAMKQALQNT